MSAIFKGTAAELIDLMIANTNKKCESTVAYEFESDGQVILTTPHFGMVLVPRPGDMCYLAGISSQGRVLRRFDGGKFHGSTGHCVEVVEGGELVMTEGGHGVRTETRRTVRSGAEL